MDYGMIIETAKKTYEIGPITSMFIIFGIPAVVFSAGAIAAKIDTYLTERKFSNKDKKIKEDGLAKILRV